LVSLYVFVRHKLGRRQFREFWWNDVLGVGGGGGCTRICELIGHAVRRWVLTPEAPIQSQASPSGICGGHSAMGTNIMSFTAFPFKSWLVYTHL
jgi:hypothetical protein